MVATIARGSSDHAATFLKYAIELTARIPVASLGPSVMSIYGNELKLDQCAAIAISQSGKSPDIVAMAESARRNGALTLCPHQHAGLAARRCRGLHHRPRRRRGEERRRDQELRQLRGRRPRRSSRTGRTTPR